MTKTVRILRFIRKDSHCPCASLLVDHYSISFGAEQGSMIYLQKKWSIRVMTSFCFRRRQILAKFEHKLTRNGSSSIPERIRRLSSLPRIVCHVMRGYLPCHVFRIEGTFWIILITFTCRNYLAIPVLTFTCPSIFFGLFVPQLIFMNDVWQKSIVFFLSQTVLQKDGSVNNRSFYNCYIVKELLYEIEDYK